MASIILRDWMVNIKSKGDNESVLELWFLYPVYVVKVRFIYFQQRRLKILGKLGWLFPV